METKHKPLSEKDFAQGKKLTTINVEVPDDFEFIIRNEWQNELTNGDINIPFEQFAGSLLKIGFGWAQYSQLKKVFEK